MVTENTTFKSKVVSVVASCALAAGLCPAMALAETADGANAASVKSAAVATQATGTDLSQLMVDGDVQFVYEGSTNGNEYYVDGQTMPMPTIKLQLWDDDEGDWVDVASDKYTLEVYKYEWDYDDDDDEVETWTLVNGSSRLEAGYYYDVLAKAVDGKGLTGATNGTPQPGDELDCFVVWNYKDLDAAEVSFQGASLNEDGYWTVPAGAAPVPIVKINGTIVPASEYSCSWEKQQTSWSGYVFDPLSAAPTTAGTYFCSIEANETSSYYGSTGDTVVISGAGGSTTIPTTPGTTTPGNTNANANANNAAKSAKSANTLSVKAKKVTAKAGKKQSVKASKAFKVSGAQGKVTYKVSSYDKKAKKKITVSKSGKVTVKKGLAKGTYKLKVQVTAAGDATHDSATKTVTLKVKVK